jgi:hypothetical protein
MREAHLRPCCFGCVGDDNDVSVVGPNDCDSEDRLPHYLQCPILAANIDLPLPRSLISIMLEALTSNTVAMTKALLLSIALSFHQYNAAKHNAGASLDSIASCHACLICCMRTPALGIQEWVSGVIVIQQLIPTT